MDCRKFGVTVVSGHNLEDVRVFGKTAVHARVSIGGMPATERRTPTDTHGGKNPAWSFTTRYTIVETMRQSYNTMLVVKLYNDRNAGDRYIGEVNISLRELFECAKADGGEKGSSSKAESDEEEDGGGRSAVMTLPVQKGSVKSQGALRIAYSFGERVTIGEMLMAESVAPLMLQNMS